MKLSNREIKEFYEVWFKLLRVVNEKHNISPLSKTLTHGEVSSEETSDLRDYIWTHPECIDEAITNENIDLNDREMSVLKDWRNRYIYSDFIMLEHRSNHTVFMDIKNDMRLYAVTGVTELLKKVYPKRLMPIVVKTALLPFKSKIIYDGSLGMISPDELEFPRDTYSNVYRHAKKSWGTSFTLPHKE